MLELLKKQRRDARAAIDALGKKAGAEKRDLSDDEKTKFDQLVAQVADLNTRIKALEDADGGDDDVASSRSMGVRSAPPGSAPVPNGRGSYFPYVEGRSRNPGFVPSPVGSPAIHTGGDHEQYSIHRAIEQIASNGYLDGLEGELSQELSHVRGKAPSNGGFFMPLGADPEMRRAMGFPERRTDLTTVTGAGSIFNEELGPMIDLLRARLVIRQLGARFLPGMRGLFSIPRQNGTGNVYWLGEEAPAALSSGSLDQVPFAPHVAIAATDISRMFTAQTSLDAERFTQDDLANVIVRELDRVAINGSGGAQPTGILQIPEIKARAYVLANDAGNGGTLTYADTVKMKAKLAIANADVGKIGWLVNPDTEAQLRLTARVVPGQAATVNPGAVWEDSATEGAGKINGYRALTTTQCPNNLVKGTATNCSATVLANWDDLVLALWEGIDVIINPYTGQLAGTVRVSMGMVADVQARHYESFVPCLTSVPAY